MRVGRCMCRVVDSVCAVPCWVSSMLVLGAEYGLLCWCWVLSAVFVVCACYVLCERVVLFYVHFGCCTGVLDVGLAC